MSSNLLQLIPVLAHSTSVPHNDEQPAIIKLNIAFIAFTSVFILSRIAVRALIVKHLSLDDYLMLGAGAFAVVLSAMSIYGEWRPKHHLNIV